jgi:hypothetical protein
MNRQRLGISFLIIFEVSGVAILPGCGGSGAPMPNSPSQSPSNSPSPSPAPVAVTIVSPSPTVLISAVQQFSAKLSLPVGNPNEISQSVIWSVSGSGCSGAGCGTIDANGKYTAPPTVPDPAMVMVTATSTVDSRWSGSVPIVIVAVAGETFTFSVSPSGVVFSNQMVNTSATKSVTLTNTGSTPQPVVGRVGGPPGNWEDFTLTSDCPSKIAVGASCTFNITFRPSAPGTRTAYIDFDGVFEEEGTVGLFGTATN